MSEGYLAQRPVAMWNSARGVWEKPETVSLLCEHLELFSESWMTSGTMRNGVVYELPMQEHPTSGSESLLLRTPAASEAERGHQPEDKARARGGQVTLSGQLNYLPTTRAQHGEDRNNKIYARPSNQPQNLENALADLLPTPNTMEHREEKSVEQIAELKVRSPGGYRNLREEVVNTPQSEWGKFEPAVKRWEQVTGMEAPAPTEPDGKDGAHRLSSKFTEWMMGLPEGWITGLGLSRKDELKACGNGVVPQQAELALRLLMEGKK